MFTKPYKLKSNNTLKNSEKKQLVQRMKDEFPSASEEKLKELVPVKCACSCMRLTLHSGDTVGVFVAEGAPVLIDAAGALVPTVCALWKMPDLLPTITIHTPVLTRIMGGAPLYVPGVEVPTTSGAAGTFPMFGAGALLCARTQDNMAAALVGRARVASADMLFRVTGVCMETLHVVGDLLCREPKFNRIERPQLGPAPTAAVDRLAGDVAQLHMEPVIKDEWPGLGRRPPPTAPAPAAPAPAPAAPAAGPPTGDTNADGDDAGDTEEGCSVCTECLPEDVVTEDEVPEDMDALLQWSLLSFLKLEASSVELPLLTNLLYKNHLIPSCPPGRALDVKKSTYKKMGKFLEAMQQEGLVEVREVDKGVSALTALNVHHERVRAHRVPAPLRAQLRARARPAEDREYEPPHVRDMYCVTAHVADLFAHVKKGSALSPAEVRAALTEYVRTHELHAAERRGAVQLDERLARAANMREQECVKWETLMSAVTGRMTAATEMRFSDGTVRVARSRLEPVRMQVATRSGNKKVTLVSNLEQFGFSLGALAHACQLGVGAACGVTRAPGAKCDQLMLQGDQTHFVAKLLIEKYGLPKKFLEGADKALNKKK